MKNHKILDTKRIDSEKQIALVEWERRGGLAEYSTHCIFPKGCDGLYHGNYYSNLEDAQKNFTERR